MKHTLSVLVENESGVLTRIAGLFARRGFNIESLSVGPAEQKNISRITMVVPGDDKTARNGYIFLFCIILKISLIPS